MTSSPLRRQADASARAGVEYLLAAQDREGFWRDYDLRAGASDAWTTAWVGWCLTTFAADGGVRPALRRANLAVLAACTPDGWGYNRTTGADGDSTAWALNFLAACGYRCGGLASGFLPQYVSPTGAVRTFLDPLTGAWSDPHPDVGAMVGLALVNSGARRDLASRIRAALLAAAGPDGTWPSFWWATRTYGTVWAGLFLCRTGGLAPRHASQLREFLSGPSIGDTVLERALALLLLIELSATANPSGRLVADLLDDQQAQLGWPPSALLLLPPRDPSDDSASASPHADVNGLVSTAMACLALARWGRSILDPIRRRILSPGQDQEGHRRHPESGAHDVGR